jgi:hypothetical protein
MCGNYGTITFESPEYAVRENKGHIRLTVQRTGGGVGEVAVSYSIYPMTAGYDDVTSTAYYTANQTIVFRPGQIRASFLLTINDDRNLVRHRWSFGNALDTSFYSYCILTISSASLLYRNRTKHFQFTYRT